MSAAVSKCVYYVLFLHHIRDFLRPGLGSARVKVFENNEGALDLARNSPSSGRTKHIGVWHRFVRDVVREGKIDFRHAIPVQPSVRGEGTPTIDTNSFRDSHPREVPAW